MKILEQIAQSIVEQTSSLLGVSMSITDAEGVIVACDRKERIGSLHRASAQVIREGREVVFTKNKAKILENVLPGIATPIRLHNQIIGVLGIIGEPSEVEKFVNIVRNHVEMILHENFRTESLLLQMKTTELFVQHLIHFNEWENNGELENYCEMLGYRFHLPRVCLILHLPSLAQIKAEAKPVAFSQIELKNVICHLFQATMSDIVCPIGQDKWIVLKQIEEQKMGTLAELCERSARKLTLFLERHHLHCKVSISYGKCYKGLEGASKSYRQAHKALIIGLEKNKNNAVYSFDSWAILPDIFLEEMDFSFLDLFADDIQKIWAHPEAEMLVKTFLSYCENNMNVSRTARFLYVHRNTLIYRLNKINQLFKIDVQSFEQCQVLYIVLKKSIENRALQRKG
ncbi:sugar diacid recognition domain-containing protein [Siminovitchia sp. FSL H7-0308]|uniref:Carbohydrate diacid regulator n=1 Tax=Siminovitchia thermophila TaxID=1245522 RepID=A0ABS2R414_9BACI|nr:sugar diacid recognition domain-containing protein [Siminovitchia thermophila]MBM7714140.1 carbohydrate diacid regulator [Siminovitchia thermophila]ONK24735.1 hypothetical protein BLX87_03580 [Bacillus sp. VT-16-64]